MRKRRYRAHRNPRTRKQAKLQHERTRSPLFGGRKSGSRGLGCGSAGSTTDLRGCRTNRLLGSSLRWSIARSL